MDVNNQPLGRSFAQMAASAPERIAWRIKRGDEWVETTWGDAASSIEKCAAALVNAGVQPGDRVAIWSANRPEWTLVDYATLNVGGIVVPLYYTSTAEQAHHMLSDSGAKLLVINGEHERTVLAAIRDQLPELETVLSMEPVDGLPTLAEFMARGTEEDAAEVARRMASQSVDDTASLVYTSGTTGLPRGVMLSHRAFIHDTIGIRANYPFTRDDSSIAFLPLAHSLERCATYMVLLFGGTVHYVTNPREMASQLPEAKPTLLLGVPKVFELIRSSAIEQASANRVSKSIFDWAYRVGDACASADREGRRAPLWARLQLPLARALVHKKVVTGVGGPKKFFTSGGAPLRAETEEWFQAFGLLVGQGYGLTETGPIMTYYNPNTHRVGTVGYVVDGSELRIDPETSEIQYRGDNVMQGYWRNPEATKAMFTEDGWLKTGDIGTLDADGYLTVTDRMKDIIVNSGGKNIAPQPIEQMLMADELLDVVVLIGDRRPHLTAIVQPELAKLRELAARVGATFSDDDDLVNDEGIRTLVREHIARLTHHLPSYEQIREIHLIRDGLGPTSDLVTPTLKVRRKAVAERFGVVIEEMYDRVRELRRNAKA